MTAKRHIERDSFGLNPVRATAMQRKFARSAAAAIRLSFSDRVQLQEALSGIASTVRSPVTLDSVHLDRGGAGWRVILAGTVTGTSNAAAVQSLHDVYRELPGRLSVDSIRLDQLLYGDAAADGQDGVIRFQISFATPVPKRD